MKWKLWSAMRKRNFWYCTSAFWYCIYITSIETSMKQHKKLIFILQFLFGDSFGIIKPDLFSIVTHFLLTSKRFWFLSRSVLRSQKFFFFKFVKYTETTPIGILYTDSILMWACWQLNKNKWRKEIEKQFFVYYENNYYESPVPVLPIFMGFLFKIFHHTIIHIALFQKKKLKKKIFFLCLKLQIK